MVKNIRNLAHNIIDLTPIVWECGEITRNGGNFSLVQVEEGYLCSMRIFGYYITSGLHRYVTTPTRKLKHPDQHLFILLDKEFNFVRKLDLVENTYWEDPKHKDKTPCLEDMRMTRHGNDIYGVSSIFYQGEDGFTNFGVEIQRIGVNGNEVRATHHWNSMESMIDGIHKNWMAIPTSPFQYIVGTTPKGSKVIDTRLNFISTIGNFDELNKENFYRGNTPLIPTNNNHYLTITHQLDFDEIGRKRYNNYFTEFDENLTPTRFSKPFKMTNDNIEFTTTLLDIGDDYIIGNTIHDETPEILMFNKRTIEQAIQ